MQLILLKNLFSQMELSKINIIMNSLKHRHHSSHYTLCPNKPLVMWVRMLNRQILLAKVLLSYQIQRCKFYTLLNNKLVINFIRDSHNNWQTFWIDSLLEYNKLNRTNHRFCNLNNKQTNNFWSKVKTNKLLHLKQTFTIKPWCSSNRCNNRKHSSHSKE